MSGTLLFLKASASQITLKAIRNSENCRPAKIHDLPAGKCSPLSARFTTMATGVRSARAGRGALVVFPYQGVSEDAHQHGAERDSLPAAYQQVWSQCPLILSDAEMTLAHLRDSARTGRERVAP